MLCPKIDRPQSHGSKRTDRGGTHHALSVFQNHGAMTQHGSPPNGLARSAESSAAIPRGMIHDDILKLVVDQVSDRKTEFTLAAVSKKLEDMVATKHGHEIRDVIQDSHVRDPKTGEILANHRVMDKANLFAQTMSLETLQKVMDHFCTIKNDDDFDFENVHIAEFISKLKDSDQITAIRMIDKMADKDYRDASIAVLYKNRDLFSNKNQHLIKDLKNSSKTKPFYGSW